MDITKRAVQQAKKELAKEQIQVIKDLILENLRKMEEKKAGINRLQKELKLLKQDQEDIEKGKIDKILDRQEKSKIAKEESVFKPKKLEKYWPEIGENISRGANMSSLSMTTCDSIANATSGTFVYTGSSGNTMEYYIS